MLERNSKAQLAFYSVKKILVESKEQTASTERQRDAVKQILSESEEASRKKDEDMLVILDKLAARKQATRLTNLIESSEKLIKFYTGPQISITYNAVYDLVLPGLQELQSHDDEKKHQMVPHLLVASRSQSQYFCIFYLIEGDSFGYLPTSVIFRSL